MGNMEVISNCKFGNSIIALVIGAGLLLVYGIYRASLPKPLAGIPYNKNAAKSLLGDMPEMISHIKETGESTQPSVFSRSNLRSNFICRQESLVQNYNNFALSR